MTSSFLGGTTVVSTNPKYKSPQTHEAFSFKIYKGTPPVKNNVFFRALPEFSPPLPPIRATCTSFSAVKKEYITCIF